MVVDWSGLVLSILKAAKGEDQKIDPKFIAIKPRVLSDHNLLRGVAMIRAALAFVPAAAIAAPILSLGEMGFKIWKRIALSTDYDSLLFPPIDPNVMRVQIQLDEELNKHFGNLASEHNWNDQTIQELETVFNDFSFMTNKELLQAKYPQVDSQYIAGICSRNRDFLNQSLDQIEQEIISSSQRAQVDTNIREALEALKELFPAMRDWSLFNSEGFDELLDIIDTIF